MKPVDVDAILQRRMRAHPKCGDGAQDLDGDREASREFLRHAWADVGDLAGELLELRSRGARRQAERLKALVVEFTKKLEHPLPCGHTLGDLVGAPGTVTKCGACLAARKTT